MRNMIEGAAGVVLLLTSGISSAIEARLLRSALPAVSCLCARPSAMPRGVADVCRRDRLALSAGHRPDRAVGAGRRIGVGIGLGLQNWRPTT